MIPLIVLLYIVIGVYAMPRISRALARGMDVDFGPLGMPEQFMCFFIALFLSLVWPLPALFASVRHTIFAEEKL